MIGITSRPKSATLCVPPVLPEMPMPHTVTQNPHYPLDNYELVDRYRRESGRVLLTGTQALVRIALMQRTLDKAAGLNTAGFVSGYRGSPLGMVDQELWRAKRFLEESGIEFLPAVNEDLAATAVWGSMLMNPS